MELKTRQIDRFSSLPLNVQDDMLSYLSTQELWKCSSVCTDWRSSILQWSGMWKCLSTQYNQKIVPELLPYRSYIKGSFVQEFTYDEVDDGDHLAAVIDFLIEQNCDSIDRVGIASNYIPSPDTLRLLDLNSSTLTWIFFTFQMENEVNIKPDVIIRHCPHLRHLYYVGPLYDKEEWDPQQYLLGFQNQHLVDMEIEFGNIEGNFDIQPFLKVAPKLKHLGLNFEDIENTWRSLPSLIRDYCPQLISLFIIGSDDGGIMGMGNIDQVPHMREEARKIGYKELLAGMEEAPSSLQRFMICNSFNRNDEADKLIPVICEAFQDSLLHLDINGGILHSECEALSRFSILSFPLLKRIELKNISCQSVLPALRHFFEHPPHNLTDVSLHDLCDIADGALLKSISTGVRFLEKLKLEGCSNVKDMELIEFLTTMAKQQQDSDISKLRSIKFISMLTISSSVLDVIATEYGHIDELMIRHCNTITIEDLDKFVETIQPENNNFNYLEYTESHDPARLPKEYDLKQTLIKLDKKFKKWKVAFTDENGWLNCSTTLQFTQQDKLRQQ